MTFREYLKNYCIENAMFPQHADLVLESLINDPDSASMIGRWDEDIEGYPTSFLAVLVLSLDDAALKWIDTNFPKAFNRQMFVH